MFKIRLILMNCISRSLYYKHSSTNLYETLILFVVPLTFSFYHSVVFGDDFKRDYSKLAKLTPEEENSHQTCL